MKVLVIEDSERLLRSLAHGLTRLGHAVDPAPDGSQGLAFAEAYDYDVVVLDLMLPGVPGLEVLQTLRARGRNVPILILSARDQVEDRVRGLRMGADDYLVKPFAFDELCARLAALARRPQQTRNPVMTVGSITIDTARKEVTRGAAPIRLTPGEYALLEFLAYRPGRVFPQDQLVEHLYRSDSEVSSNVIEVLVSQIRKKLHVDGEPPVIRTRRGFGYVFEP